MIELMPLPYNNNSLEPVMDALTVEIHHDKHHQAYVNNLNKALEKYPDLQTKTVEELLTNLSTLAVDETDRLAIRNHGGGVANHNLFWQIMNPANQPDETLKNDIVTTFGLIENFKQKFSDVAGKQFGSGWAWLSRDTDNQLIIQALPNQDSPLSIGHTPILALDVWEHAYYLKYQNRRPDYITAWWNLIKILN